MEEMTVANYITVFRLLLIPVFAGALLYYNQSSRAGSPDEVYRLWAVWAFVIACLSDAVDGYVARAFNQRSHLGTVLDPLADKSLILVAILVLAYIDVEGFYRLPLWFPVLVISRDLILVTGTTMLHFITRDVKVRPHWTGKVATFLQMVLVAAILMKLDPGLQWIGWVVWATGFFVFVSMAEYLARGAALVRASGWGGPHNL
jgi:CDP-diacylglycerol--glycerol-3-phosphate 3-phosphatidyltransferase/cardiolipin synthase